MEKIEILKQLNELTDPRFTYSEDELLQEIGQLKKDLLMDIKKENFITTPNDKKQLAAIKRVLKVNEKVKPILATIGVTKKGLSICDGYRIYLLNKNALPFKTSFTNDFTDEEQKKYMIENRAIIPDHDPNLYPNVTNFFENINEQGTITADLNDVIIKAKTLNKCKDNCKKETIHFTVNEDPTIAIDIDPIYIKDMVDILKIKDKKIKMIFTGSRSPLFFTNENGSACILPAINY